MGGGQMFLANYFGQLVYGMLIHPGILTFAGQRANILFAVAGKTL